MDEEAKPSSSEDASTKAAADAAAATAADAASSPTPSGSESAEGEEEVGDLVEKLAELVDEIAVISDFRNAYRRQFCNLSRRIRLLVPMLEEAKEGPRSLPEASVVALRQLREALAGARELLRLGTNGSRIFLVLEREKIMQTFQDITSRLEQALAGISFDELGISDEVREQLQLVTISDLNQESLTLHEMASGGDPGAVVENMSMLLKKIKDFMQTQDPVIGIPASTTNLSPNDNSTSPVVPDDFRCPISLDLMKDPVIVSTRQV